MKIVEVKKWMRQSSPGWSLFFVHVETGQQTKEKVGIVEDEHKQKVVDDFAQVHLSETPEVVGPTEHHQQQQSPSKPPPAEGLIL